MPTDKKTGHAKTIYEIWKNRKPQQISEIAKVVVPLLNKAFAEMRRSIDRLDKTKKTHTHARASYDQLSKGGSKNAQAVQAETVKRCAAAEKSAAEQYREKRDAFIAAYREVLCIIDDIDERLVRQITGNGIADRGTAGVTSFVVLGENRLALDPDNVEEDKKPSVAMICHLRAHSPNLEEQVNDLFSHTSVRRAAEEKDSVEYRKRGQTIFDKISERSAGLEDELREDGKTVSRLFGQLKGWENQSVAEGLHKAYRSLVGKTTIEDRLKQLRSSEETLNAFIESTSERLRALRKRFCGDRLRKRYRFITNAVAVDFDHALIGRYQEPGPVALVAAFLCACVILFQGSPPISAWWSQILALVFVGCLIMSAAFGYRRRSTVISLATKLLGSGLNKIFPKSVRRYAPQEFRFQDTAVGDVGEELKKDELDWFDKLGGRVNRVHHEKDWLYGRNAALALGLPFVFAIIAATLHGDLPNQCFLGSKLNAGSGATTGSTVSGDKKFFACGESKHDVLALGRLVGTSDGDYVVRRCTPEPNGDCKRYETIPTVIPASNVTHVITYSTKVAQDTPPANFFGVELGTQTRQVLQTLVPKEANQTTVVNAPPIVIHQDGKVAQSIDALTNVVKDKKLNVTVDVTNKPATVVAPVVVQVPTAQTITLPPSPDSHFFSTVFVNGEPVETFKQKDAILLPIFDRSVTAAAGFLDEKGDLTKPFLTNKFDAGLDTPDKALLFGLTSLHAYRPGTRATQADCRKPGKDVNRCDHNPPKAYLNHLVDYLAECVAKKAPVELEVLGFASPGWLAAKGKPGDEGATVTPEILNHALSEGRRLAVIAHIEGRLRQKLGAAIDLPASNFKIMETRGPVNNLMLQLSNSPDMISAIQDLRKTEYFSDISGNKSRDKLSDAFRIRAPKHFSRDFDQWAGTANPDLQNIIARSVVLHFKNAKDLQCNGSAPTLEASTTDTVPN